MLQYLNPHTDIFDDRAVFANFACRLLYQKHNGDLTLLFDELTQLREFFDEHVRNIYELVHREIPLFYYHQLISTNAQNFDITEEEYQQQIQTAKTDCKSYYI